MTDETLSIDPRRTALLVMDYQPAIIARVGGGDELVARVRETIAAARSAGVTIGYVRVAFEDQDYAAVPATNASFSAVAAGRLMHAGDPSTDVHPALAPRPGDIVVRKTRVGPFSTTDLHRQLRDRGIDTLALAGLSTSGVVLSTVREGADLDYRLVVLADACGDPDGEVHELLVTRIFPRQATVADTAAFARAVSAQTGE